MDYSKLHNPYDFANPVMDPKLFAGRRDQLEEINYYMDHAKNAPRAINLAIIGERASGKTSLLNMVQIGAEQRGFCVVRVELDEADADYQLPFFHKLFDAIITSACDKGGFNGLQGKTYEIYRNMVDAYEIPEEKTFCSLIFPMQYANAMSKGNISVNITDTGFKRDLQLISQELSRPIAILIDECDILSKSRVHLEKIRNIFMNTPGYMLVFTGTEALFPLINDVFSPIVRQFKKINVAPFDKEDETKDCIRKPLLSIGVKRLDEIFDFETYQDVSAIHDLSGGRPYEIQLICHLLFRRVQQGRAEQMELTIEVLDDVLRELQSLQDVSGRQIVNKIRSLDKDQLSALRILCSCDGRASFEQIWFMEYIFTNSESLTKEKLREQYEYFIDLGLIKVNEGNVCFVGDDFDKIYIKYYSRKHKINFRITRIPYQYLLMLNVDGILRKELDCLFPAPFSEEELTESDLEEIFCNLKAESSEENPFDMVPALSTMIYEWSFDNRDQDFLKIALINLKTPWNKFTRIYLIDGEECGENNCSEDLFSKLESTSIRANELEGSLSCQVRDFSAIPINSLIKAASSSKNSRVRESIYSYHIGSMYESYNEDHNLEDAHFHGELALQFSQHSDPMEDNNLGYLFLSFDELEIAKSLFLSAINHEDKDPTITSLANYNLGILLAKEGNIEEAQNSIRLAIIEAEKLDEAEQECSCLITTKWNGKTLIFEEQFDPNLLVTANNAIEELGNFLVTKNNP